MCCIKGGGESRPALRNLIIILTRTFTLLFIKTVSIKFKLNRQVRGEVGKWGRIDADIKWKLFHIKYIFDE